MGIPPSDDTVELRSRWAAWLATPYPKQHVPGAESGEVNGIDLALLHGDAASVISVLLDHEEQHLPTWRITAQASESDLRSVVPFLEGEARTYFATLQELLDAAVAHFPER